MSNFGINLAASVQTVIGKQTYIYEAWASRALNDRGYEVDTYGTAETRTASVQPIDAKNANKMGLSLDSFYIKIIDPKNIDLLSRTTNPGRVTYNGYYWRPITPSQDWQDAGGWNEAVCVRGEAVS